MYPVGKILKPRLKYFVKNTFQDENRRIDEYKPFESNVKNVFFFRILREVATITFKKT